MVAAAFGIFCAVGREGDSRAGAGVGAAGAVEEGAPVPVFVEVAEAVGDYEVVERGDGVLRREGDAADGGAGGYGSAVVVVRIATPKSTARNGCATRASEFRAAAGPEEVAGEAEEHQGDGDEEIGEFVGIFDGGVDGVADDGHGGEDEEQRS